MKFGNRKLIGSHLYARLYQEKILHLNGSDITRQQLVERYKCGNFAAAQRLDRALHRMNFDLWHCTFDTFNTLAREKGVGPTTLYVALCVMPTAQATAIVNHVHVTLPTMAGKRRHHD